MAYRQAHRRRKDAAHSQAILNESWNTYRILYQFFLYSRYTIDIISAIARIDVAMTKLNVTRWSSDGVDLRDSDVKVFVERRTGAVKTPLAPGQSPATRRLLVVFYTSAADVKQMQEIKGCQ